MNVYLWGPVFYISCTMYDGEVGTVPAWAEGVPLSDSVQVSQGLRGYIANLNKTNIKIKLKLKIFKKNS